MHHLCLLPSRFFLVFSLQSLIVCLLMDLFGFMLFWIHSTHAEKHTHTHVHLKISLKRKIQLNNIAFIDIIGLMFDLCKLHK